MRTVHLLAVAYPILAVLAFAPSVPALSVAPCLVVLLVTGELWLRALVREPLAPIARLGLAIAAGLASLPLIALILHALAVRIEGRWLAAALAVLVGGLGAGTWRYAPPAAEAASTAEAANIVEAASIVEAANIVEAAGTAEAAGRTAEAAETADAAGTVGAAGTADAAGTDAAPLPARLAPHPGHWVGPVEQTGTTTSVPESTTRPRGPDRTAVAVAVPAALAILIGGAATVVYQRLPHPAEPGYTSLALAGWAAGIAHPVTFPAAGLEVPVEVSGAGEQPVEAQLLVHVGGRLAGPATPVAIGGGPRSVQVHVPAPPDGCLHRVRISLGPASTVFYGRGPGPARPPGHPSTRTAPAPAGPVTC